MANNSLDELIDGITNNLGDKIGWEILKKIITVGGWVTEKIISWVQGISTSFNQPAGIYQILIGVGSLIGIWFIFKAERKFRWYIRWGLLIILALIIMGQFR